MADQVGVGIVDHLVADEALRAAVLARGVRARVERRVEPLGAVQPSHGFVYVSFRRGPVWRGRGGWRAGSRGVELERCGTRVVAEGGGAAEVVVEGRIGPRAAARLLDVV